METHINITLFSGDLKKDIRIPRAIEVSRLIRELDTIFAHRAPRRKYQLRVSNKGLILDEGKFLKDFPVTSGDRIEIMEVY